VSAEEIPVQVRIIQLCICTSERRSVGGQRQENAGRCTGRCREVVRGKITCCHVARSEAACWEMAGGETACVEVVGRTGRCWQMARGEATRKHAISGVGVSACNYLAVICALSPTSTPSCLLGSRSASVRKRIWLTYLG